MPPAIAPQTTSEGQYRRTKYAIPTMLSARKPIPSTAAFRSWVPIEGADGCSSAIFLAELKLDCYKLYLIIQVFLLSFHPLDTLAHGRNLAFHFDNVFQITGTVAQEMENGNYPASSFIACAWTRASPAARILPPCAQEPPSQFVIMPPAPRTIGIRAATSQ
jgi:hypothetical protein